MADRLDIPAISTGEMLRAAVAAGSELGRRVEEILNSGALVDDETMAAVVRTRLEEADATNGFLLDGYPRNNSQADTLAAIFSDLSVELDIVWFIDVPEQELVRRALARRRKDDKADVIEKRLAVYREQTDPLVARFNDLGLLYSVDGNQSIENVTEAMVSCLKVEA